MSRSLRLAPRPSRSRRAVRRPGRHAQSNAVAPTPAQVSPEVDRTYTQLMASPAIQKLLDAVKADHERAVEDLKMLTEIEAPPFKEHKRAEAFLARMKALGLATRRSMPKATWSACARAPATARSC
jgi:tripeptide aminopeptidase